ncbi:MAG: hypothetical protein JEZ03_08845 [Bacteroidales bacterium]|nr:hypothetical protein [Bacteroidales bacterium]
MKKLLISALLVLVVGFVVAQDQQKNTSENKFGEFGENFKMGLGLFSDIWVNMPEDLETSWFNRGFSVNGMYNFQLGESSIHFGVGAELSSHNLYMKNTLNLTPATGEYKFSKIPSGRAYDYSKVNVTYVDVPFELRIISKIGIHVNPGFKVGYLISNGTKYKGTEVLEDYNAITVTQKVKNLPYFNSYRYGPTLRIGYKWINLTAYYQLSTLFEKGHGSSMAPVSVGIAVIPF